MKRKKNQSETAMMFFIKEAATGEPVTSPRAVYESLKDLGMADQESFWVIAYNGFNKEIFRKCLFLGSINSAPVDMRIIFKRLLAVGANSWIAIHNHPSGALKASAEDIVLTEQMCAASKLLGLPLLDHFIIAEEGYFSFNEHGLI